MRANVKPQLAALFEEIYGLTTQEFVGYCMQMIGASFLTRNEHLGANRRKK